ncbi:MAG: SpoIID/LytB domain-containing protein [Bacillota bacterium]
MVKRSLGLVLSLLLVGAGPIAAEPQIAVGLAEGAPFAVVVQAGNRTEAMPGLTTMAALVAESAWLLGATRLDLQRVGIDCYEISKAVVATSAEGAAAGGPGIVWRPVVTYYPYPGADTILLLSAGAPSAPGKQAIFRDVALIEVNGRPYRGRAELSLTAQGRLTVINRLGVEEYLLGVVPGEMPSSWPLEALKAQAVAARTYALIQLGRHGNAGYDVCPTVHCQMYLGVHGERASTSEAVRATRGVVATYGGRLIDAVYHSHAGGQTDDVSEIWGGQAPYLAGTSQTHEGEYRWTVATTGAQLGSGLAAAFSRRGEVGPVEVISVRGERKSTAGRNLSVWIEGAHSSIVLPGETLRGALDIFAFKSLLFKVNTYPGWGVTQARPLAEVTGTSSQWLMAWPGPDGTRLVTVGGGQPVAYAERGGVLVFTGQGYGHGVGMSQWGAYAMARAGYSYQQILQNFYRGITLQVRYR